MRVREGFLETIGCVFAPTIFVVRRQSFILWANGAKGVFTHPCISTLSFAKFQIMGVATFEVWWSSCGAPKPNPPLPTHPTALTCQFPSQSHSKH